MLGIALPATIPASLAVGGSSTALALTVSRGVWLVGIIVGIISTLATIVGVIYGVRWKIAYEVERKAREGERALNESLEDRVRTLAYERDDVADKLEQSTQALHDCERTIARLEALPNLERVLELMHSTFERIMDRVEELHAENNSAAKERVGEIIEEIRRRTA